jgi:multiple antibiotic resistance protein
VDNLNLADMFVTFLALLGPQKVLLSFARMARTLEPRSIRRVALAAAVAAIAVETACALAAPWIATFFHISGAALELAAGLVFFVYAVGLVLGLHFDAPDVGGESHGAGGANEAADPAHPLSSGFREMLLPFVVSPLAVAAALEESLSAHGWAGRWTVAGALAAVVLVDLACAWAFAPLLSRINGTVLDLLSRLLGILLTAVGVQLFLQGLADLGVHFHELCRPAFRANCHIKRRMPPPITNESVRQQQSCHDAIPTHLIVHKPPLAHCTPLAR